MSDNEKFYKKYDKNNQEEIVEESKVNTEDTKETKVNQIKVVKHKWPDEIAAEKKQTRKRFVVVLVCILCFASGYAINNFSQSNSVVNEKSDDTKTESEKLNQIYEIMSNDWYFGKDDNNLSTSLIDRAIKGMVSSDADLHTEYLSSEDANRLTTSLSSSIQGIGVSIYNNDSFIIIEKVYANSPAEKSGVEVGDIITKVDGKSIEGLTVEEVSNKVRGEKGTKVNVSIEREGKEKTFSITRDEVSVSAYGYIENEIGILELDTFSDKSDEEIAAYLELFKKKGIKNIILDLRDNGGGYVNTAVNIASYFVEEGKTVLYQKDKDGNLTPVETVDKGEVYSFDKVEVIINENTASASEILTECLKTYIDCDIVGAKSYGKGTIQTTMQFKDGSYFKYTIAEWLNPNKESINGKGIKPDYVVNLDEAITMAYDDLDTDKTYDVDSVGKLVKYAQLDLKCLGYDVDRKDGYYSTKTEEALKKYQSDKGYEINTTIDKNIIAKIESSLAKYWHDNKDKIDTQMLKAKENINGK